MYVCIRISFIPEDLHIVVPSSWSSTTSIQHCRSSSYMIVIVLLFLSLYYFSHTLFWCLLSWRVSQSTNQTKTNQSNQQNISNECRVEVGRFLSFVVVFTVLSLFLFFEDIITQHCNDDHADNYFNRNDCFALKNCLLFPIKKVVIILWTRFHHISLFFL